MGIKNVKTKVVIQRIFKAFSFYRILREYIAFHPTAEEGNSDHHADFVFQVMHDKEASWGLKST